MVPLVQSSFSTSLIMIDNKHSFTARGVIIKPETKRLNYRSRWSHGRVLIFDRIFCYHLGAIEENKAAMKVIQVTATDKDTGTNAIITYSITGGNSKSHFAIDPKNGDINTTTSLNFEKTPVYNMTVTASDSKFSAHVNVIIQVVDVNDNRPSFDKLSYVASVAENSRVLTSVVTISASDPDPFGQLTYSIESAQPGNQSDAFSVDFSSGIITTADVLDRESIDTYVLQVKVTDSGEPALSGFATVTVNVTDKNDNPPIFNVSSFHATIPENSDIASFVVKIQAEDADLGSNARISYFINSSNDMSAFVIDPDTGIISINKKLDRENISNYLLKCVAIDHGQAKLSSMPVAVHVTLSDVNDNAPAFLQSVYAVNVSEDVTSGTVVEEVVAVDPDAGLNGTVVYSISGGNNDDTFTIGNKTGGWMSNSLFVFSSSSSVLTWSSRRHRRNLSLVSSVCVTAAKSLYWAPT